MITSSSNTSEWLMACMAIRAYGEPEVIRQCELSVPTPSVDEVLIRVKACGVNPADAKWRAGLFEQYLPVRFPYIPGYDIAGTVEYGGRLAPGTRVAAMLDNRRAGAYAQFAVASVDAVASTPDELDDDVAAVAPTSSLTGYQVIDEHVQPNRGERVLITGAVGAVGRFALYAAKARGAHVIAAVREFQQAEARALGADETVVLGAASQTSWAWDHVVDTIGGGQVAQLCQRVQRGGKIATLATTPIPSDGLPSEPKFYAVHPDAARLSEILRLLAANRVPISIARRLKLTEAADAHRLLEAGGIGGKIVLRTA